MWQTILGTCLIISASALVLSAASFLVESDLKEEQTKVKREKRRESPGLSLCNLLRFAHLLPAQFFLGLHEGFMSRYFYRVSQQSTIYALCTERTVILKVGMEGIFVLPLCLRVFHPDKHVSGMRTRPSSAGREARPTLAVAQKRHTSKSKQCMHAVILLYVGEYVAPPKKDTVFYFFLSQSLKSE